MASRRTIQDCLIQNFKPSSDYYLEVVNDSGIIKTDSLLAAQQKILNEIKNNPRGYFLSEAIASYASEDIKHVADTIFYNSWQELYIEFETYRIISGKWNKWIISYLNNGALEELHTHYVDILVSSL